jgi:hypothetical protein
MKQYWSCAGILVAICAAAFAMVSARTPAPAEAQAVVQGPTWEYKVVAWGTIAGAPNPNVQDAEKLSKHYTQLAEQGWEYIRDLQPGGYSVFKRSKR